MGYDIPMERQKEQKNKTETIFRVRTHCGACFLKFESKDKLQDWCKLFSFMFNHYNDIQGP